MAVSQKDIATKLGISQMTVSLALNRRDDRRIKPELATKIRETAKKLGYYPSVSAQILRTAPTDLGLLILLDYEEFRPNLECHDVISYFIRQCRRCFRKFQLEWFDQKRNPDELPRMLTDGLVGGIVCFGHASDNVEKQFNNMKIPVVKINEPGKFNICFDMENDVKRAVKALANQGHKRIGMFNCSVYQVFTAAKKGFLAALDELKMEPACLYETKPDGVFTSDIEVFVQRLKSTPANERPTVLLADTALTAKALVSSMQQNGIRIPQDIGIFTFCSIDWENDYFIPRLSGLEYTFDELIESAVGLLLRLMNHEKLPEQRIVVSQKITFRDSVIDMRQSNIK